jgi:hypothetical protein
MIKTSTPFALAFAGLLVLVASCASAQAPGQRRPTDCSDDDHCRVQVSVTCDFVMFCRASVDFDEVRAHGHNVFWEINNGPGQNFTFDTASGIAFKTAAGQSNFRCQILAGGQRFKCDNGRATGEFEYGIKVIGVPRLDPWVVN